MLKAARRPIGPASPQPLAIIAGLPSPNHQAVASEIERAYPTWKVISSPFPRDPKPAYSDRGAIFELLRQVATFAEEHGEHRPPRPGLLALFYVKDQGDQGLLNAFGFSTHAVPLEMANWEWPQGRHWRRDPDIVLPLIRMHLGAFGAGGVRHDLRLRMERQSSRDALLLPPRNFAMAAGANLFARFEASHAEGAVHELDMSDVRVESFTDEDLPQFFRNTGERRKDFCVDDRGLVFATSVHGQHGSSRILDAGGVTKLDEYRPLLEGCYHFGTPLRDGFQHDVQWRDDRPLVDEAFVNVDQKVSISASHANIFANDKVR